MATKGTQTSEFKYGAIVAVVITALEVVSQAGILGDKWSAFIAQIILAAGALGYTGARTYFKAREAQAAAAVKVAEMSANPTDS